MKNKIKKVIIQDNEYPYKLRKIKNPPKELYYIGDISILNEKCFAIIGSRSCTEKGKKISQEYSTKLSLANLIITSGMAKRHRWICTYRSNKCTKTNSRSSRKWI